MAARCALVGDLPIGDNAAIAAALLLRQCREQGEDVHALVLPAASKPNINRRISFDPKIWFISLEIF